jgi:hypothetical protein
MHQLAFCPLFHAPFQVNHRVTGNPVNDLGDIVTVLGPSTAWNQVAVADQTTFPLAQLKEVLVILAVAQYLIVAVQMRVRVQ